MAIERVTDLPEPPRRDSQAHKGSFGRVLIIAGSRGMSGAACLAGLGALRGGAGLVYLAVPNGIAPIVSSVEPSYLTLSMPEEESGGLDISAIANLAEMVPKNDVIAIGPGCGQSLAMTSIVEWIVTDSPQPVVIDADGLNALSSICEKTLTATAAGPRILTPHPGEFARLTGTDIQTVQSNRESMAAEFATRHRCVLLLKGAGTIITDGARLAVNATGNNGMATGGSGDVLTGLIAALLAQGLSAFEAAQLGAHLHGLAGDLAADDFSEPGLIASDLPRYLAKAWKEFRQ